MFIKIFKNFKIIIYKYIIINKVFKKNIFIKICIFRYCFYKKINKYTDNKFNNKWKKKKLRLIIRKVYQTQIITTKMSKVKNNLIIKKNKFS